MPRKNDSLSCTNPVKDCTNTANRTCKAKLCQLCCASSPEGLSCGVTSHKRAAAKLANPSPASPSPTPSTATSSSVPPSTPSVPPSISSGSPSTSAPTTIPSVADPGQALLRTAPTTSTDEEGAPSQAKAPYKAAEPVGDPWAKMPPGWHSAYAAAAASKTEQDARKRSSEAAIRDREKRVSFLIWQKACVQHRGYALVLPNFPTIRIQDHTALVQLLTPNGTSDTLASTAVEIYNGITSAWDVLEFAASHDIDTAMSHQLLRVLPEGIAGPSIRDSDCPGLQEYIVNIYNGPFSVPAPKRRRVSAPEAPITPNKGSYFRRASSSPLTPSRSHS